MITDTITRLEAQQLLKDEMSVVINNIRKVIKEKGITQKELGMRIDKSKEYVNYLLRHPSPNPKQDLLVRISNKIGISMAELHTKI